MMAVFFIVLVGFLGWIVGIIGFFRAGQALAELRDLRAMLARSAAAPPQAEPAPRTAPAPAPPPRPVPPVTSVPPVPAPAFAPPADAGQPQPTPAAATPAAAWDLEALLTLRWGVWLGAVALLLAGMFLVRYAVEQGLLGPGIRCTLAALLGLALIGAAEWLHRQERPEVAGPFRRDQAPAALAAGGTAMLLVAAYGAGPFYGLLSPLPAFAALAGVSLIGLAASLRYGPLAAAVGIAGAFATPALVATDTPSMPGLFAYLFVVSAAALAVVGRTAWTWLGWAATLAGAAWVCVAAGSGAPDLWAAAVFVPAAAALNLALLPGAALQYPVGRRLSWVPFAALAAAGLMLECAVPGTAPRLGLFLLSPVAVAKGMTEPRLDRLPWLAALFGLLALLLWALPEWHPTGEVISIEGVAQAILPGDWAPEIIRPLLTAAALFAAFHAAAGLWLERRASRPLHWAALPAAVPVLTLAVTYAQVARFQSDMAWAAAALALTAALTGLAALAATERAPGRAGAHAAGAVAALALGCAMQLHDHWLTLALSLFLPALAWIEAAADLPPLRRVALAVAAVVMARLLLNWYVLDYAFGDARLAGGLFAAYGVPATAFAFAAILFRRRGDDTLVATLEAGAVAFLACLVALSIRRWYGDGGFTEDPGFTEAALHLLTLGVQATAYLVLAQRTGRPVLGWAWRILGGFALAHAVLLLVLNPMVTDAPAGVVPLLAAYVAPAALALFARRRLPHRGRWLAAYALLAGFAWITLQIRAAFHPLDMGLDAGPVEDAELWAWSGGWLAYGIGLMILGIRAGRRTLRLAALGVIALVCAKVFLVDMADLTGLWRVLSFLGLGIALIGLGAAHRRFVPPKQQDAALAPPA